ncbi:exodeoxyribonuclease VII small subunit [Helicobacter cetorum]|uniref:exodeoxyribonuclease VII small subunit n=1 Tax=Helicobacter cetorum TaxID=138563 RepID=UPI000CF0940A|nr:exodeoxyribonuclease VII small subunit [Helicobacter cetorum]
MENRLFEVEKSPKRKSASKTKSFEEHIQALEQVLERLNNAELPLKEGIELYQQGMQELTLAQKLLEEAHKEYEKFQTLD